MKCSTCKNPIDQNDTICEWCNSSLNPINENEKQSILYKGECIFYSKRIKKSYCFFEIYKNEIVIFNYDEGINIKILRNVIYNVRKTSLFSKIILSPLDIFKSYSSNGWEIITSKSGENIIYLKKQNYEKFSKLILQYI
jgi:hypothetical protein